MNKPLLKEVESAISAFLGKPIKVLQSRHVSGGCIHNASIVSTNAGRDYFYKSNPAARADEMFRTEVDGLAAIRNTNTIAVPDVIAVGRTELEENFLVMEAIRVRTTKRAIFRGVWATIGGNAPSRNFHVVWIHGR